MPDIKIDVLAPCPCCAEARKGIALVRDLINYGSSEAQVVGSLAKDRNDVHHGPVEKLQIHCSRCHHSGVVPSSAAADLVRLFQWLVEHADFEEENSRKIQTESSWADDPGTLIT